MTKRVHTALARKRKRLKESKVRRTFNSVLNDVLVIQNRLENIEDEVKSKYFPKNSTTGLLVDMLVQVKNRSDDIKEKALDKSFVYNNIEFMHNCTLKKMFEKDPELEAMFIKRVVNSTLKI